MNTLHGLVSNENIDIFKKVSFSLLIKFRLVTSGQGATAKMEVQVDDTLVLANVICGAPRLKWYDNIETKSNNAQGSKSAFQKSCKIHYT